MATASLAKKSVKDRFCHKQKDIIKLRDDLRKISMNEIFQRCKSRMQNQREELLNLRRFGVNSDDDVEDKIKEIFYKELVDVTEEHDVPEVAVSVKKIIKNEEVVKTEDEQVIIDEYHKFKEEETSTILNDIS
ncbi:hypothetical protein TKK_0012404 [Trichogramma kaykai]|uniref:Uncharacterized protein n=1 Tax=Trichogramma kaykai TaxID=54128 RepID=A0ABD2WNR9_9HYME